MQSYNDFLFTKGKGSEVIKKEKRGEKRTQRHRVKRKRKGRHGVASERDANRV